MIRFRFWEVSARYEDRQWQRESGDPEEWDLLSGALEDLLWVRMEGPKAPHYIPSRQEIALTLLRELGAEILEIIEPPPPEPGRKY